MPLRDFICDSCGLRQERYFQQTTTHVTATNREIVANEQAAPTYPPCESCDGTLSVLPLSQPSRRFVGAVFPFTTTHVDPDGKPMTIESMGHLRAVEREYGVVLSAFSKASNNDLTPIKDLPRYLAQDEKFARDHGRGRR